MTHDTGISQTSGRGAQEQGFTVVELVIIMMVMAGAMIGMVILFNADLAKAELKNQARHRAAATTIDRYLGFQRRYYDQHGHLASAGEAQAAGAAAILSEIAAEPDTRTERRSGITRTVPAEKRWRLVETATSITATYSAPLKGHEVRSDNGVEIDRMLVTATLDVSDTDAVPDKTVAICHAPAWMRCDRVQAQLSHTVTGQTPARAVGESVR